MTEQSATQIQDVITAILDATDQDKIALFTSLLDHPTLQEAQTFARDGQAERFLYALPYPLERVVDGLLQTVLPGKREAQFILRQYRFLNVHFQKIIQRLEGFGCSGDKSRTILDRLLQYYLTGKEVVFDPGEQYTFGHPTVVFTTHREIVEFFEGLYALYYGNPEGYLKALKNTLEITSI
ncbi:hypothetical protein HAP94_06280 [Acidithiobacillus ferrivorans]|nr:hypothetical protein [Acidithiobacillus ferrivorans]